MHLGQKASADSCFPIIAVCGFATLSLSLSFFCFCSLSLSFSLFLSLLSLSLSSLSLYLLSLSLYLSLPLSLSHFLFSLSLSLSSLLSSSVSLSLPHSPWSLSIYCVPLSLSVLKVRFWTKMIWAYCNSGIRWFIVQKLCFVFFGLATCCQALYSKWPFLSSGEKRVCQKTIWKKNINFLKQQNTIKWVFKDTLGYHVSIKTHHK